MKEVEEMKKKEHKCSLCGKKFVGFGNNPEPLAPYEERGCDECNTKYVIPARIYGLKDLETTKKALPVIRRSKALPVV